MFVPKNYSSKFTFTLKSLAKKGIPKRFLDTSLLDQPFSYILYYMYIYIYIYIIYIYIYIYYTFFTHSEYQAKKGQSWAIIKIFLVLYELIHQQNCSFQQFICTDMWPTKRQTKLYPQFSSFQISFE